MYVAFSPKAKMDAVMVTSFGGSGQFP
jgi:hypothetical protein